MEILLYDSYQAARDQMDSWNILASVPVDGQLSTIFVNEPQTEWAIIGTDCINNGGLGRDQIAADVDAHLNKITVATYDDFFALNYYPV